MHEPEICKYLRFLDQNVGFALFSNSYLKTGIYVTVCIQIFILLQHVNYFKGSGVKLSIHYYMEVFIIVWYLHVS